MVDFKQKIADQISKVTNISQEEIYGYIEVPSNEKMGDFSFPCFKLAKTLKKAPQTIAEDIQFKIELEENLVEKIEVVNGYLNFHIHPQAYISNVLTEMQNKKKIMEKVLLEKVKQLLLIILHQILQNLSILDIYVLL